MKKKKKIVKYAPSLFTDYEGCFLCKKNRPTQRHEIFFGITTNRDNCKRYGVWVNLCKDCHEEVHRGLDPSKKEKLFKIGQDKFDEVYGVKKFGEVFSKKRFI